jgi:WD40 repeat protein
LNTLVSEKFHRADLMKALWVLVCVSLITTTAPTGARTAQERVPVRTIAAHKDRVLVAFSPSGVLVTASVDTVKFWDVKSLVPKRVLTLPQSDINSLALSPNGEFLAVGCSVPHPTKYDSGKIVVWEVKTGKVLRSLTASRDGGVWGIAFSPDSREIAATSGAVTQLWNAKSGALRLSLKGSPSDQSAVVCFSPDGALVAVQSEDLPENDNIKIWNTRTGSLLRTLSDKRVTGVAISPDGKLLVTGGFKELKYWDVASGKLVRTSKGLLPETFAVVFSPDGKMVASGSSDFGPYGKGELKLWDARTGKLARVLAGHRYSVTSVAFSPDGRTLASGSDDKTAKIWTLRLSK